MSLTLVATFKTKEEAHRAVDALAENGCDRQAITTTVRREISSFDRLPSLEDSQAYKAIALVAMVGAILGAALGSLLSLGTLGIEVEILKGNLATAIIAGAMAGLAIGTYSGAVASVRRVREQHFDYVAPQLATKERVMVSLNVPDERQESIAKVLRKYGAFAVREWSLLRNETPHGLQV